MKIELKKISFNERMSEETNCFVADLFIDGKKVGYVKNDGCGGQTDYRGLTPADNETIRKAEAYCKTLPDIDYGTFKLNCSLEHTIDQLFEDWIMAKMKAKTEKKMAKQMLTCVLVGSPDENRSNYSYYNFKRPLSDFPKQKLQEAIVRIKANLKPNEVILNTNLQALGVQV